MSVMTELASVRECVRDCCAPARTRRNVERTTSCVKEEVDDEMLVLCGG